jgi:hypothetical protein
MKIRHTLSLVIGLTALSTMFLSASAQAQMPKQRRGKEIKFGNNTTPTPTRFSLDLGAVSPEKNSKTLGSQGLLWGVGYVLPKGDAASTGKVSLDLVQAKLSKKGSRLETTGLFYSERLPLNGTTTQDGAYYGLGLGYIRTKVRFSPAIPAGNTQFAVRAMLGLSVSDRLRLESSYIWAKKVRNYSISQFTLALGVQF